MLKVDWSNMLGRVFVMSLCVMIFFFFMDKVYECVCSHDCKEMLVVIDASIYFI